jgi:type I restriction enzyme S subunit
MQKNNQTKFKETEIGFIPEEWDIFNIADAVEIIDGDRGNNYPNGSDFIKEGYSLFLNAKNVCGSNFNFSECQFINKSKDEELRKGKMQRGDFVLTTRGTVGNIAYYDNSVPFENMRINSGMVILRNGKDFNSEFLFQLLKSEIIGNQISELTTGSAQPQLPIRDLKYLKLIKPPLGEQEKIAQILVSFDEKIELNRKINANLKNITSSLFKRWFVDFEFPDKNGKSYKFNDGKMITSELGLIPDGWRVATLKEISRLMMGLSPKGESYNEVCNGTPLLNGASDFKGKKIIPKKYTSQPTRICKKGDLVLCIRATIGNLTFADNEYCLGRGVASLTPSQEIFREYIYFTINRALDGLKSKATGSVISGLSKPDIEELQILLPNESLISSFHNVVSGLLDYEIKNDEEIISLELIRDSFLPRLMSGKIRAK